MKNNSVSTDFCMISDGYCTNDFRTSSKVYMSSNFDTCNDSNLLKK